MEKIVQNSGTAKMDDHFNIFKTVDWTPVVPDLNLVYAFSFQNDSSGQVAEYKPPVPFTPYFYFEPDGYIDAYPIKPGDGYQPKVNIYRLRDPELGHYLTANLVRGNFASDYLSSSPSCFTDELRALQQFIFLLLKGEFRLILPFFNQAIVHASFDGLNYITADHFFPDALHAGWYDMPGLHIHPVESASLNRKIS